MIANRTQFALSEAKDLLSDVDEIVTVRGAKVERLSLNDKPDDQTLERALIGPSGRLRAPAARVGRRLLVGFDEATYREALG